MNYGYFISFEGIDGTGKTTIMEKVAQLLREQEYKVLTTHEPGGVTSAENIRHLIFAHDELEQLSELLLFEAARSELVQKVLVPSYLEGYIILCDRFTDSTIAYQSFGGGLPIETVQNLNQIATKGFIPEMTIYLNVSSETRKKRLLHRTEINRYDLKDDSHTKKLLQWYESSEFQSRAFCFDNSLPMEQSSISEDIAQEIMRFTQFKDLQMTHTTKVTNLKDMMISYHPTDASQFCEHIVKELER